MSELLLVSTTVSMFGNSKTDSELTSDTAKSHGIPVERLAVAKKKVNERDLRPVRQARNAILKIHRFLTTPYGIDSVRILSSDQSERYEREINAAIEVFNMRVSELQNRWEEIISTARRDLNGSFRSEDYPDDITAAFEIERSVLPFPSDSHLSAAMENLYGDRLREELETRKQEATESAYRRLLEPVAAMAERLRNPDAIFRDSLVENVRAMAEIGESLNVSGDYRMTAALEQIQGLLATSPDELRSLPQVRQETAAAAAAIVAQFGTARRVINA